MVSNKTTSFLASPLFSFVSSALVGYFVVFKFMAHLVCWNLVGRGVDVVDLRLYQPQIIVRQQQKSLLDQQQSMLLVSHNKQDINRTKNQETSREDDNIKAIKLNVIEREQYKQQENQYEHPHKNVNSKIKLACFIYPNKVKSAEIVKQTWLPLCGGGKVLDGKEYRRGGTAGKKALKVSENEEQLFQQLLSPYITKSDENFNDDEDRFTRDADNPNITNATYDYFLFTEAGSYILVSNLLEYLKNEDDGSAKAYGHAESDSLSKVKWTVEGSLVLNRLAVEKLLESEGGGGYGDSGGAMVNNSCGFAGVIPDTKQLLACLLERGGDLIDSRDHTSKITFLPNFNPYYILSNKVPTSYKSKHFISATYCQDNTCLSPFPVALHDIPSNELRTTHFFVTWCRYALFLGNYNDPSVSYRGLTFNGEALSTSEGDDEKVSDR